jgi:ABC-type phosphate/phosphonate transport system substrate-binding protein
MKRWLCLFMLALPWQGSAVAETRGALLLGINEGVAAQQSAPELQEKYKGLAAYLATVLKKPVHVESSQSMGGSANSLKNARYDLMYVRPSNVAAKAMRDNHYTLVATVKGEFTAAFIVNKDSPLKKPEDIRGLRIAMSEPKSLMAKAGLATLRDMGIDPKSQQIHSTRYQEAVGYMVQQKFADVGVVAPILAQGWEKKGGTVLFKSRKLPFWSVISAPGMSQEDGARVRQALINLETADAGRAILARMGVKGFVAGNQQDYLDMLKWLGE